MNSGDRRRVAWASALTVVALPAIWMLGVSDKSASPSLGAAGAPRPEATAAPEVSYKPELPVFLDRQEQVAPPPAVIDIAVPPATSPNDTAARASYKRLGAGVCWSTLAPGGTHVTVTNVANRQSIACRSVVGALPDGVDIIIDTDDFAKIGNLADSPIHVRISW